MSTDISIKPAGTPTASPFLSSNDATRDSVRTQLPPQQTVTPSEKSFRAQNDTPAIPQPVTHQIVIDKSAATVVYQTVDERTSEVIGQYPAADMLRRRAYFRALDIAKADSSTITTDRTA